MVDQANPSASLDGVRPKVLWHVAGGSWQRPVQLKATTAQKARRLPKTGGRWCTLPDGRHVMVTAPKKGRFGGGGRVPSEEGRANQEIAAHVLVDGVTEFDWDPRWDAMGGWEGATVEERAEVKASIAKDLAAKSGLDEDMVNRAVGQWAVTSSGDDRAIRMQASAVEEFALEMPEYVRQRLDELGPESDPSQTFESQLFGKRWANSEERRSLLRSMYDQTQERFRENGLTKNDVVTLSRGVRLSASEVPGVKVGDTLSLEANPLSSWSLSRGIAQQYARGEKGPVGGAGLVGVVLEMDIPIGAIVSTARTGFGCLAEGEFVVLGTPSVAQVVAVRRG